jgi:hypothetical protein
LVRLFDQSDMEIYFPELSDFDDPEEWMLVLHVNYSIALRERREAGDHPGRETLLQRLRAAVQQALELKIMGHGAVSLLARNTTDPQERLRLYSIAYEHRMADLPTSYGFDEQGSAMFEAGGFLREIGLIHEAQGNLAEAEDCFARALAHLHQGADLFETHCLSEDPNNNEGETFPLRPQLVMELERLRKRRGREANCGCDAVGPS